MVTCIRGRRSETWKLFHLSFGLSDASNGHRFAAWSYSESLDVEDLILVENGDILEIYELLDHALTILKGNK